MKLYDIEASRLLPKLVREVLTEMDLDVLILPCPSGGSRFRPEGASYVGGKQQFPLLIDDNTDTILYESADIIDYLRATYLAKAPLVRGLRRRLAVTTSYASSVLMLRPQGVSGVKANPSRPPERPLELYSFEASPFSKPVRARLCELGVALHPAQYRQGRLERPGPAVVPATSCSEGPMGTTRNRRWLAEHTDNT